MKISIVVTILNEAENIKILLSALASQSKKPDEIIIVDGGSTDATASEIKSSKFLISKLNLKFFVRVGNRSVGRNFGVKQASGNWIAFTDAGCVPGKSWLEELVKPTLDNKEQIQVVAGYYKGLAKTAFQEAVIPYALVMPERVDAANFLPATRSMLINKSLFESLGGFNEKLDHNEDYAFAKNLQKINCKIAFAKKAQVAWIPPKNLFEFNKMIFRFACGDAQAKIFRPKVFLIFLRYLLFLILIILDLKLFALLFVIYLIWSISKNNKYTKHSWFYLPLLQITSDLAVMLGTSLGLIF